MYLWLETNLRALLARRSEEGQAELLLIAIIAFVVVLLATGHRVVVQ
jgi:hypothetical protein